MTAAEMPLTLAITVMEMRAYERAKRMVDDAKSLNDLPGDDPMVKLVMGIQADILKESRGR